MTQTNWSWWGRVAIVALAAGAAAYNGAATAESSPWQPVCIAVLCGVTLLRREWWPAAAAVCTLAAGLWGWPMLQLLLVALYDAASAGRVVLAVTMCVVTVAGNIFARPGAPLWDVQPHGAALFAALAVVLGLWARNRRTLVSALRTRVDQLRVERQLREEAARMTERSVIASEMHDVLAHRLSLIALHAGVLASTGEDLPPPVRDRLSLVRTAASDALGDLRDVLTALHEPGSPDEVSPPPPTDRSVRDVISEASEAGQQVQAVMGDEPPGLPASHRLAVLRVVQESLTNARKHAPGVEVNVRIEYLCDATTITVRNRLPAVREARAPGGGFGLTGLTERVRSLGGQLRAGVDVDHVDVGVFTVHAVIPREHHRPGGDT